MEKSMYTIYMTQQITPNLWFNNNAQEAVDFYMSVFKDGKILNTEYYSDVREDITGHKKGDVLTIEFEILGTKFIAINAGPEFKFNPSVSFLFECDSQEEIDEYWRKLSAVPEAEQCGWVQDKYGVSWQITPKILAEMLKNGTEEQRHRVFEVFMPMKKLIIADLENAYQEK
jgi:predicted 3-demethylubiquinone-9 3-methyltransferase (glyoxalase superfamily)